MTPKDDFCGDICGGFPTLSDSPFYMNKKLKIKA